MSEIAENIEMMDLVNKMARNTKDEYFEYIYRGNFTPEITQNIINLTANKFYVDTSTKTIRKRITFIMIECLQNITRHQDKPAKSPLEETDLFILQKFKNIVYVSAANIIKNENILGLKEKLDLVVKLNPDELKAYYKAALSNGEVSDKGGAGLGILSMARRTDGHVFYKFKKIDDQYSYFYIQNRIYTSEEESVSEVADMVSLDRISKFHLLLNKENILLNFNGAFAFDNLESILPILESQIAGGEHETKTATFELTVKLLKNIIFFADNSNGFMGKSVNNENTRGVFLLCKQDNKIYLTTTNYIENKKIRQLKNKIDLINNLEKSGLLKVRNYIGEFLISDEKTKPDLSLLDMRIKSNNKIFYKTQKVNNKVSLFVIQVIV